MRTDSSQSSPYTPPTAPLEDAMPDAYEPKVFSIEGRIGRVRFLAYSSLATVLAFGLLLVSVMITNIHPVHSKGWTVFDLLGALPYAVMFGIPFVYARRRLHDIGVSGWQSLLLYVPVLGIWALCYVACTSGTTGPNTYGPPSKKNRFVTIAYAILLPPLALLCFLLTILNLIGELRRVL